MPITGIMLYEFSDCPGTAKFSLYIGGFGGVQDIARPLSKMQHPYRRAGREF